jgi:hypothetical protein
MSFIVLDLVIHVGHPIKMMGTAPADALGSSVQSTARSPEHLDWQAG